MNTTEAFNGPEPPISTNLVSDCASLEPANDVARRSNLGASTPHSERRVPIALHAHVKGMATEWLRHGQDDVL